MIPLTETEIRASFVNASRREATQAVLPDLTELPWERMEYLGWTDRKYPLRSYVVVPASDGTAVGVLLRASETTKRPRAMCAWCEDIVAVDDVALLVAKRAGSAGRAGNTIGTLVHTDFSCSSHVRRPPTRVEAGEDPAAVVAARIDGLRDRSAQFVERVLETA